MEPMQLTRAAGARRERRSLRRALVIDCDIECDSWDGVICLRATDVSNEGLWVETQIALNPGAELVLSFALPDAAPDKRMWATAKVARVGMWRRRDDIHASGMGLVFTYCSQADRERLAAFLVGRPPPVPDACLRSRLREVEAHLTMLPGSEELALPPVLDTRLLQA
jgi:hypothetical protein